MSCRQYEIREVLDRRFERLRDRKSRGSFWRCGKLARSELSDSVSGPLQCASQTARVAATCADRSIEGLRLSSTFTHDGSVFLVFKRLN